MCNLEIYKMLPILTVKISLLRYLSFFKFYPKFACNSVHYDSILRDHPGDVGRHSEAIHAGIHFHSFHIKDTKMSILLFY